jgi:ParB family chromosome partitioning protein
MAVPVDEIRQNPMQPRRSFGEQGLASLAASIRSKGALQPVLIRPAAGGYELVAGERRLRAARIAGLAEIPAIVRSVPDHELLELALVENIHREDLNPIDRARAYRALQERYDLSHEEIAQRLGDDRSTIANYVRLLGLSEELVSLVSSNELGVGHAKALLGLSDPNLQTSLGQRVVREGWSVRRLEAAVAEAKHGEAPRAREPKVRPAVTNMEQKLGEALGTRVIIRESRRRHSGRIVIEYYSLDDFERIVMLLGVPEESS